MSKLKAPTKVNATPSRSTGSASAEKLKNVTRGDKHRIHTNDGSNKPDCGGRDSGAPWKLTEHRITCDKCKGRDKGNNNPVVRKTIPAVVFAEPPAVTPATIAPRVAPRPAVPEMPAPRAHRKPRHAVPDDLPVVEAEVVDASAATGPGQELVATTVVTPAPSAAPEVTVIEDKTWTLELSKGGKTLTFEPVKAETYEDACRAVLQQVTVVGRQTREVMSTGILARLA